MPETKSTITFTGGKINFKCMLTKKSQLATVACLFDTNESRLLLGLLNKFITEKVLSCGLAVNNQIAGAICTSKGIIMHVPDNKVFPVIAALYKFLMSAKIAAAQFKQIGDKTSYNKLRKDINEFSVIVYGKCKSTLKNLEDKQSKKIANFKRTLSAIEAVKEDDVAVAKPEEIPSCKDDLKDVNEKARLYFAIAYAGEQFDIEKNKINVYTAGGLRGMQDRYVMRNSFNARVKAFVQQFGNPSVGKTDAKSKDKNALILASMNIATEALGHLYGFKYQFGNVKDIKTIDSVAMGIVKAVKI